MSSRAIRCPHCQQSLERIYGMPPKYCDHCHQSLYDQSAWLISNLRNNKRLQRIIGITVFLLILIPVIGSLLRS